MFREHVDPRSAGSVRADGDVHPAQRGGGMRLADEPHATIAYLWGRVDASSRDQASAVLARALDRRLPLILDTRDVTSIDSVGMAFLIQCHIIGRGEGLDVTVANLSSAVADSLTRFGAHDLIAELPHPSAALAP